MWCQCDVWAASQVLTVLSARPGQIALINLVLIIQYTQLALSSLVWRQHQLQSSGWVWVSYHLVCVFIITSLSPIIKLINMSQPIISITNNINLATENLSRPADDHASPSLGARQQTVNSVWMTVLSCNHHHTTPHHSTPSNTHFLLSFCQS